MSNYCIYTDKIRTKEEITREHIFPLSLGGVDGFEIPADRIFNNDLGSKIDGKLANDFLIMFDRKRHDARGHSNKKVDLVWKKARFSETNKPIQLKISDKGVEYFCPIEKRILNKNEISNKTIQSNHIIDRFIRLKFTAKTVLSAGYFIYGDLFRSCVDTESLRDLMNMTSNNMDAVLTTSKLRATDQFTYKGKDETDVQMFKLMAEMFEGSSVIFILSSENLVVSVSTLGTYLGTINVPAQTESFPNEGDYRLGHVVYIDKSGTMNRLAFHSAVGKLAEKLGVNTQQKS